SYCYKDYNTENNTQHMHIGDLSLGPLVRYYFLNNKIAPFIEAYYTHDIYKLHGDNTNYLGYNIGIGFGMNYFVTSFFALEPYISYQYSLGKFWDYEDMHAFEPKYYHAETTDIGIRLNYFIN
ncbi:MAG: hypothetical protein P8Z35_25655, partial [Ignavibacteriaceae bacterium]